MPFSLPGIFLPFSPKLHDLALPPFPPSFVPPLTSVETFPPPPENWVIQIFPPFFVPPCHIMKNVEDFSCLVNEHLAFLPGRYSVDLPPPLNQLREKFPPISSFPPPIGLFLESPPKCESISLFPLSKATLPHLRISSLPPPLLLSSPLHDKPFFLVGIPFFFFSNCPPFRAPGVSVSALFSFP